MMHEQVFRWVMWLIGLLFHSRLPSMLVILTGSWGLDPALGFRPPGKLQFFKNPLKSCTHVPYFQYLKINWKKFHLPPPPACKNSLFFVCFTLNRLFFVIFNYLYGTCINGVGLASSTCGHSCKHFVCYNGNHSL